VALELAPPAPWLGIPVLLGGGREYGVLEGVREGAALEEARPEEAGTDEAGTDEAGTEEAGTEEAGTEGVGKTVLVIVGSGGGEPLGRMLRTRWTRRAWCSASPTAARPATRATVNLLNSIVVLK
jgi:hypothetical protein